MGMVFRFDDREDGAVSKPMCVLFELKTREQSVILFVLLSVIG